MKLGNGNIKFKFKFIYESTGRTSIKNVYANNLEEAKKLFEDCYLNYDVKILDICII